ncbi:MAG: oligosaccharide flippase family protein [Bacteroidales bacterium]|nr:oligosaccharide flippase family protein [Bacteroidales bacterium]
MSNKFLKNLAFLLFLNLLVKPFWILGIDRQVQNVVGTENYGFYFAIFNFSYLFIIFLDLGIANFNSRSIAQDNELLQSHFGGIASLKLILGLVYGIVIFIIGWLIGYDHHQMTLLAWVGFNQFLLAFILYLRSNLSGLLLFKTDSIISVLDRLLMIAIVGVLLWTGIGKGRFTIEWFVYSQTAAYLVTAIIALLAVLRKSGKISLRWDWTFFKSIIKSSLPFALLFLIMSLYSRIDSVLIERLLPGSMGSQQAGVYAQGYRLLDAGQNLAFLFAVLLLPLFSKMIKDRQEVGPLVKLSASILLAGALLVAISSQFYAKDLMTLMYTRHPGEGAWDYALRMNQSADIFRLLMWSFVAISSGYIFGTLLTANNNLNVLNVVAFSGLALNIFLNFLLIPSYLAYGSAVATLATEFLTAGLQVYLVVKYFQMKINWRLILNFTAYIVALVLTGFVLQRFLVMDWKLKWLLFLVAGGMAAVLLKLWDLKNFARIAFDQQEK